MDPGERISTASRTPRPPSSPEAYGRAGGCDNDGDGGPISPPGVPGAVAGNPRHFVCSTCDDGRAAATGRCVVGVLPGAEPFAADGGEVGVVLSHGFTGSPQSLRPWAEHLAAAGLTVRLPRLPGHGTRWQDLNDTRWPDWYGEVERAFDDLRGRCRQVFGMGLSMGGTLVLRLAEQRPAEVAGLVLVNPSLGT